MEIQSNSNYLIYPDGRVWSNCGKGRFLKETIDNEGYKRVKFEKSPKLVHRLIAIHYIPNPENKPCIDHINRDRCDNRICNLRWVTRCENNNNAGENKRNTSGHKCISYCKTNKIWKFQRGYYGKKRLRKHFKSKIDAICYKYIIILKIKALNKLY